MTNGGKSTLSQSLHQQIPNSCVIAQDSYFKVEVFLSRKSCQGFLALLLKNWKLYLFTRMTQRCQRTAMDLSNMIVRVEKSILKPYITVKYVYFSVVTQTVTVVFSLSAGRASHGHDDERRWFMAKRSSPVPEEEESEAFWWTAVCADRGRFPHFQLQVFRSYWLLMINKFRCSSLK